MIEAILFFIAFSLPLVESINRSLGYNLFIIGGLILGILVWRKKYIAFEILTFVWLLLLALFSLSTVFSWSLIFSIRELVRYFALFIVFSGLRVLNLDRARILNYYSWIIIGAGILLSLLAIAYKIPSFHFSSPENGMNLFYSSFGHNRLSSLLLFAIPLSIAIYTEKKTVYNLIIPTFFGIMLIVTFSRGSMMVLALVFLFFGMFKRIRSLFYNFYSGIFSILAIVILLVSFYFSNINITVNSVAGQGKDFFKPASFDLRFEYFRQSIVGFLNSPIFGTGPDTFRYVSQKYQSRNSSWSWYSHNHFLELFTETGLAGGLIFIFLIFLCFRSVYFETVKKNIGGFFTLRDAVFIAVCSSAINSFIDYDWQYLSLFLFFWTGIALILPKIKKTTLDIRPVVLIFFFLSFVVLIIPPDSSSVIKSSDKMLMQTNSGDFTANLERASILDSHNGEIYLKLAQFYSRKNKYDSAHAAYHKVIYLDPLDSETTVADDNLLYLKQAEEVSDSDMNSAKGHIREARSLYPFYYKEFDNLEILGPADFREKIKNTKEITMDTEIKDLQLREIEKKLNY